MKKFVLLACMLVCGAIGGGLVWLLQGHSLRILPASISYADLVAVLLTGVSAIVAVLAVILAIMAFWGYTQFRKMVRRAVETITPGYLAQELKEGESRNLLINTLADFTRERAENPGVTEQLADERAKNKARLDVLDKDQGD